eukprot:Pgem_evm1s4108
MNNEKITSIHAAIISTSNKRLQYSGNNYIYLNHVYTSHLGYDIDDVIQHYKTFRNLTSTDIADVGIYVEHPLSYLMQTSLSQYQGSSYVFDIFSTPIIVSDNLLLQHLSLPLLTNCSDTYFERNDAVVFMD